MSMHACGDGWRLEVQLLKLLMLFPRVLSELEDFILIFHSLQSRIIFNVITFKSLSKMKRSQSQISDKGFILEHGVVHREN